MPLSQQYALGVSEFHKIDTLSSVSMPLSQQYALGVFLFVKRL